MIIIIQRYSYLVLMAWTIMAPTALWSMRSSRVADRYTCDTTTKRCSCFSALCCATRRHTHGHCPQQVPCQPLITAIEQANLSAFQAHLTPDNANETIDMDDPHNPFNILSLNILEFLLKKQHTIPFILACIELLIEYGFDKPILDTIIASENCELLEAFLKHPAARRIAPYSPQLPLDIYRRWNIGRIETSTAQIIARRCSESDAFPQPVRTQFAVVDQILEHGSLRMALGQRDIALIARAKRDFPEIVTFDRLSYGRRSVTVDEYIDLLHQDKQLTEREHKTLKEITLPGSVPTESAQEKELDTQPRQR